MAPNHIQRIHEYIFARNANLKTAFILSQKKSTAQYLSSVFRGAHCHWQVEQQWQESQRVCDKTDNHILQWFTKLNIAIQNTVCAEDNLGRDSEQLVIHTELQLHGERFVLFVIQEKVALWSQQNMFFPSWDRRMIVSSTLAAVKHGYQWKNKNNYINMSFLGFCTELPLR